MRNKQKAWRTAATKINREKGMKHCGRAQSHTFFNIKPAPFPLLNWLLSQAR